MRKSGVSHLMDIWRVLQNQLGTLKHSTHSLPQSSTNHYSNQFATKTNIKSGEEERAWFLSILISSAPKATFFFAHSAQRRAKRGEQAEKPN
jgi:hypothetical protein